MHELETDQRASTTPRGANRASVDTVGCGPSGTPDLDVSPGHHSPRRSVTVDEERRRIAQGLHDDVGQTLAAATLRLHEVRLATDDAERSSATDEVERLIRRAIASTRNLTFDLRSPVADGQGFDSTVHELATRFVHDHRIACLVDSDVASGVIGPNAADALYPVVRELLRNVAKHARATDVRIRLVAGDGTTELAVSDNGIGIGTSRTSVGLGLTIARERIAEVGGRMRIESAPDGTTVTVTIPNGTK